MTNPQKAKGDRAELEVARLLHDELGLPVRRKLGAGRADDAGDLDGLPMICAQVKNFANTTRAINDALNDLPEQTSNAGATWGVGFIRRPGGRWVVVMDIPTWCSMYREVLS